MEEKIIAPKSGLQASLAALDREMRVDALHAARGNGSRAETPLGISDRLIRLRIAKYGIDPKHYKH